ncbi:MAG: ABC transporter permease [Clostridiales bacterium]|nr:ABC transporter permease [Clostridiales bacterium]
MKKYISLFRIRFINGLQYRAAAYAGIVTQFAWGLMEIMLYRAFYRANRAVFPMEFSQMASYVWLKQAFVALFMAWYLDNEIFMQISSGNIAYELSRPMDLYNMWFTKNMANRYARVLLRCIPILVVAIFVPKPYGLSMPPSPISFIMFLITAILGSITVVAFCMIIYINTFYTLSPSGMRSIAISITDILAGAIIPLPFFPEKVLRIVKLTPFASMQNLSFLIYSGNITGSEMWQGISLQVFHLIALIILGKVYMNRALKRVVVQGG